MVGFVVEFREVIGDSFENVENVSRRKDQ